MEDRELIRLSQQRNGEAFGELVKRYKGKVFSLAYGITRDRAAADDLAQEVFIKAYFALPKFKFQSEFGTWLYRISVNHIKDYLRKNKARHLEVPLEELSEKAVATTDPSHEEVWTAEKRRALVQAALARLPEKHRIILILRDIQGLSYEEISRILALSAGTVDSRLHRARKKLRKKIVAAEGWKGGEHEL